MRRLASMSIWLACAHELPPPSACHAAADHVQALLAVGERAHDAIYKRCVTDAWPREVVACMIAETPTVNRHCKQKLPDEARDALDRDLGLRDVPDSCLQYRSIYHSAHHCDQLADEPRARITEEYRRIEAELDSPAADSAVVAFSCLVAIKTARELAGETCGF
jgi:hypothetical protein